MARYKRSWRGTHHTVYPLGTANITLSGSILGAAETDIVSGGKTIILTIYGDNWVASGATFDAQRANIIAGMVAATSQTHGWNNVVLVNEVVTAVVRTSDTVVTITLSAEATYDIASNESITVTVPSTALLLGSALVASPFFTITASGTVSAAAGFSSSLLSGAMRMG